MSTHKINTYVWLSVVCVIFKFGRKSIALSMYFSIYVIYSCLYPESKYGLNEDISFGGVSRKRPPVYIFGYLTAICVCPLVCFLCPFGRCLVLGLPFHILYPFLVCFTVLDILCIRIYTFTVYHWLWLACPCSIDLLEILILMLGVRLVLQYCFLLTLMASGTD